MPDKPPVATLNRAAIEQRKSENHALYVTLFKAIVESFGGLGKAKIMPASPETMRREVKYQERKAKQKESRAS